MVLYICYFKMNITVNDFKLLNYLGERGGYVKGHFLVFLLVPSFSS